MQCNEIKELAIFKDNGDLKSKEDFLKEVEEFYDEAAELNTEKDLCQSAFDIITDPESLIDVEATIENFDFRERSIFIVEEIEQHHANSVFEMINFWNTIDEYDDVPDEERIPIKIYINSPGGDLNAVFSIISSIKASRTPVHTVTFGTGYSGGFFIGISGHKRYGFPYSSYMFHEGSVMDGGDSHKFLQNVDFYKKQMKRLKNIVVDNTKITSEQYDEHKKDDWFFDAEEAIQNGVIDEIISY